MLTQAKTPKLSSTSRKFLGQLEQARTRAEAWRILLSEQRQSVIREVLEEHLYSSRKRLLVALANLHDDGFGHFQRQWKRRFWRELDSESELLAMRDQLRQVWTPEVPLRVKQRIVDIWLEWRPGLRGLRYQPWIVWLPTGRLVPFPNSLHAQLVQGALEHARHFKICQNPDCAVRYFIARRKDQKYCERGVCTDYAQRKYSLNYWNKKGKKGRAQKRKREKPRGKSRRRVNNKSEGRRER